MRRHPLKWYHSLGREMTCSVIGHKWKSSWRERDNRAELLELEDFQLSYKDSQAGNPYCEYSGGWKYKCKRCRKRLRDPQEYFVRQQLWHGIKYGCLHLTDIFNKKWWDELPLHKRIVASITDAIVQFFIHQDWMWDSIVELVLDASDKVMEWVYNDYDK